MNIIRLEDRLMLDDMAQRIEAWAKWAPGEFSVSDVDRELELNTFELRRDRTMACEKLVADGIFERVGKRRGVYRMRQCDLKRQDLSAVKGQPANLWMPFNLTQGQNRLVDIYPGNIITIGGEKNSGKTAFMLNIAITNRREWNVHYFNSEMPDEELALRTGLFDCPKQEWDLVNFYFRHRDFSDVIFNGKNDLNIIDFLEISDDFYLIGQLVRNIFDRLGDAIAIIAVQKKTGADNPRGGEFVKEKSRLHLDLSHCEGEYRNKMQINPAKNWAKDGVNPTGLYVKYKLAKGNFFKPFYDHAGNIWFRDEYAPQTKRKGKDE